MTAPADAKQILAVIPAEAGGRAVGSQLASLVGTGFPVTVVETTDEDMAALNRASVILTGLGRVTAEQIAAAANLELIQCASHGFDYIDLAAARARDITVCNIGSSDAELQDVAEQTFALMLALAKQLVPGHIALTQADWALPRLQHSITELHGKVLGIIGLGHIGQQVARRGAAFDMEIVYTDPSPAVTEAADRLGARRAELDDLLRSSDYIVVLAPLTDATRHLIDAERLALVKPTAFIVNTARGAIIDQDALADALVAGRIAGAGVDVFDPEPPTSALRLLRAPNVVLSPHVGGVTRETLIRIAIAAASNVLRYLEGKPPADVVS
ncbi:MULTISPECIES: 2-hydroxyacid dehydrogenase [Mycobacterium]|uniref:2-hydroxyacid dehydrogenase n=1 Tax=Mycobacterium kiyosense TaxID=2871094 RepID=A0A9P3QCR3_9MYCO|nr:MULTISPECIES: 2-hydroxyacid dehydrogenase [Mycobacterium]BDB40721.1 2-hydroxyacid dehydrogenase [Mycobacterium kiyosense]BDE12525.1 2-hydroxyacid dehydrogenase [Mycobacterium sp. 20KCMC460]GLB85857.1 2-hydroxyacid dehydrogenase [Mycobacterium kiyosense]GLB91013.1 2-hydroxyacid dehydrogenase [Mycobacterium kiyosense]GLB96987.1 2-hydroxyacid dehydrogenase [Mycobacterium kiyosense]